MLDREIDDLIERQEGVRFQDPEEFGPDAGELEWEDESEDDEGREK
ncbi:MAG: hypothetical protein U0931_21135 [Vulcanimicrobiota bacterium]